MDSEKGNGVLGRNDPPHEDRDREPIDVVVTWVDGSDPKHRAKLDSAAKALGKRRIRDGYIPAGFIAERFSNDGELWWCLHSIRKFIPWVRKIYLVTDNQTPQFLTMEKQKCLGVSIVDHSVIFRGFEGVLPTFNSRTIETMIWRIPNLSDRFLYLNDDFFFIKPVSRSFFWEKGKCVLRGRFLPSLMPSSVLPSANLLFNKMYRGITGRSRTMNLMLQRKSAAAAGFRLRFFRVPHFPHLVSKSMLEEFYSKNPEMLSDNVKYRFRNVAQHTAVYLSHHLDIRNNSAVLEHGRSFVEIDIGQNGYWEKLENALLSECARVICFHNLGQADNQSKERLSEKIYKLVGDD